MKNIVVIYGGKSPEHDVSILTGLHCAGHITDDYRVRLVYITKRNKFVRGKSNIDKYIAGKADRWSGCYFSDGALFRGGMFGRKICDVMCVVNCCHGGIGEGGELAGIMKAAGIPITSCDFTSAFAQQSKTATRKILSANGFAQPKFVEISKLEYDYLNEKAADNIKIELPVIVKPDNLGSSIGITAAKTKAELIDALHLAFTVCDTVIVEEFIADMKEVNIAVMTSGGEIIVSAPENVGSDKFFSFDEKYLNPDSGFIKKGESKDDEFVKTVEPQITELAKKAYELFGSCGVVRSDFIVAKDKIILNENNTVPGFMAYHLWLKKNIPYGVVTDSMITDAISRFNRQKGLQTDFVSDILLKNRELVIEH